MPFWVTCPNCHYKFHVKPGSKRDLSTVVKDALNALNDFTMISGTTRINLLAKETKGKAYLVDIAKLINQNSRVAYSVIDRFLTSPHREKGLRYLKGWIENEIKKTINPDYNRAEI